MGKLVLECVERRLHLNKLAKAVHTALLQKANIKAEIVFTDAESMQSLNRSTRGVDSVTDVLSYPSLDGIRGVLLDPKNCRTEMDGKYIFIGSIVLCEERIREQAKEIGHSEKEETEYLIVHGLMHLFGYDHMTEEDKTLMRSKEKQALLIYHKKDRERAQNAEVEYLKKESEVSTDLYRKEQAKIKKEKDQAAKREKAEAEKLKKAEESAEKEKAEEKSETAATESKGKSKK